MSLGGNGRGRHRATPGSWSPGVPSRQRFPLRLSASLLMAILFVVAGIAMDRHPRGISASPLSEPRREVPEDSPPPAPGAAPPASHTAGVPSPTLPAVSPFWRQPESAVPPLSPPVTLPLNPPVASAPRAPGAVPRVASPSHLDPQLAAAPSSASLDLATLASKVDPGLVDINIKLSQQNLQAAGTGIMLDPSGVVLTNNHVINGATSISVTDVGNGRTYPANVVGYDRAHDVAVIQLQGATGLPAAAIGDSGTVAVGDRIAAIGNAGGRGGTPSIVAGMVSALNQTVTVSDEITGSVQRLTGLIQVAAGIQPGDSGGPLVNTAGEVIGVTTAGSTAPRGSSACTTGLAIPINDAIAISTQIRAGTSSATVHIGATGILGVLVRDSTSAQPSRRDQPRAPRHADVPGALIASVVHGSASEQAGLAAGDVIVSLDGTAVDSPDTLTTLLIPHHPTDSVQVGWVDPAGQQHSAPVVLAAGPPA